VRKNVFAYVEGRLAGLAMLGKLLFGELFLTIAHVGVAQPVMKLRPLGILVERLAIFDDCQSVLGFFGETLAE